PFYVSHSVLCRLFCLMHPANAEIYTLSLHDALPISSSACSSPSTAAGTGCPCAASRSPRSRSMICKSIRAIGTSWRGRTGARFRSEEHTSELQSRVDLVCRLLLEKKKNITNSNTILL